MTIFSDEPGSIPNIETLIAFIKETANGGPNILYFMASSFDRELRKIVIFPNTGVYQYGNRWKMSGFAWQRSDGTHGNPYPDDHIAFNNGFDSLIFTGWWHVYAYRLRYKLGDK
jgi:hypothetical protein